MDPLALGPHGRAMLAYFHGHSDAVLDIHREDGLHESLAVAHFFRSPDAFTPLERAALGLCRGDVLDIGAGSGLHTLFLQSRDVRVTAIDLSPEAVDIMRQRGVCKARQVDVRRLDDGSYDTLLLLGHGIGMVQNLAGLDHLLERARRLCAADGQLLIHSLDVTLTSDARHLAYQAANRKAGRHPGEIRLRFGYDGELGPYSSWLHVDPATLDVHARRSGWAAEVIFQDDTGDYLARLTTHHEPADS